jgi:hypothetical protein
MQRGKKAHTEESYDLDDPFEAFGSHDLGVADRDFWIGHQEFTEDDIAPITNWIIVHGNEMERTVWLFDVLAPLQVHFHLTPAELAWELDVYNPKAWTANYAQTRGRLRDKLCQQFAADIVLVAFLKRMFPIHENKRKPKKPKTA